MAVGRAGQTPPSGASRSCALDNLGMPKLPQVSGSEARRDFDRADWVFARQHGSHMILTKQGSVANLSVPNHRELAPGTLRSLLRNADLSSEASLKLLQ